jgi:hypothetical protein
VLAEADPDVLADAVVRLCRSDEWASLGQRARSYAASHLRLCDCLARERLCQLEVIELVRAGKRVPAGIHERMQPELLSG